MKNLIIFVWLLTFFLGCSNNNQLFLKNSKGEGWSLPGLEALSTGLRVISKPLPSMVYLNDKNCDFFLHYEGLKKVMWENWRRYRKHKVTINKYSWKEATIKLSNILKEIYEKQT